MSALREGQVRKAERLDLWLTQLLTFFSDRILPVDVRVADLSGILFEQARGNGSEPGWMDAQIAATASVHELVLLTRNARHFAAMEVDFRDPFAENLDHLS